MKPRILIVDDEPQIGRCLRRRLRDSAEVELATSGDGALGILERFAADLVLSDFRMPGTSSVELLRSVRERQPATLRVLMSGLGRSAGDR
jgi:DNA-binding NtrC family response regulator